MGVFVFHQLRGQSRSVYGQVAGGSLLMALGALAISLSSATEREHSSWHDAADREGLRYGVNGEYIQAGLEGRSQREEAKGRTVVDWLLIAGTSALFVVLAAVAKLPQVETGSFFAIALAVAMLLLLGSERGFALQSPTRSDLCQATETDLQYK